jgi:hypothetical protein
MCDLVRTTRQRSCSPVITMTRRAGPFVQVRSALQAAQAGEEPILIRVDTAAGHGAGKPTAKQIAADTDVLTFLAAVLPGTAG